MTLSATFLRRSALLLVVAALSGASPAVADTQHASGGDVEAELWFEQDERTDEFDLALEVTRAGQRLDVAIPRLLTCRRVSCGPASWTEYDAIKVRDLDGDGDQEVLLDLYTGGVHCCLIAYVYRWTGTAYEPVARDFADPAYRLASLSGDGRVQFITADPRFAYRWAAFAFSFLPEQILEFDGSQFVEVTAGYPARIRREVARDWRAYRRLARSRMEVRGAIASWAANRYRLGERIATLRQLRRMARRGQLNGFSPRSQRKFVTQLDAELRDWGYRPSG